MVDQNPIQNSAAIPGELRPAARPPGRIGDQQGPAFRVLLEKLEQQARGLEQASQAVDEPGQLADAVDQARTSLDAALSLSDRLLEAYRAAQQSPEAGS